MSVPTPFEAHDGMHPPWTLNMDGSPHNIPSCASKGVERDVGRMGTDARQTIERS